MLAAIMRLFAGISDVMPRTGWNDNGGVAFDFRLGALDPYFAGSFLYPKELGSVLMDLFADFLSGPQRHQHKLHLGRSVENTAKIRILLGHLFNVADEAFHGDLRNRANEVVRLASSKNKL